MCSGVLEIFTPAQILSWNFSKDSETGDYHNTRHGHRKLKSKTWAGKGLIAENSQLAPRIFRSNALFFWLRVWKHEPICGFF